MFDWNLKNYGYLQLIAIILLNIIGLVFINSALATGVGNFTNQLFLSIFSLAACVIISMMNMKKVFSYQVAYYAICLIALLVVFIFGESFGRNSRRWINLPFINMQFQPSEFAKLFLILYFAKYFEKIDANINRFSYALLASFEFVLPAVFVLCQPNLSSFIILSFIFASMMYVSDINFITTIKLVGFYVGILLFIIILARFRVINNIPFIKEYQIQRLTSFFSTSTEKDEGKYQQENALIAIGSGRFLGKGIKNSSTQSVKNGNWLAEEQNDFIFAVVGEESGFLGSVIIILIYIFLVVSCYIIAVHQQEKCKKLVCVGVGSWIGMQSIINLAVSLSMFPNTGVPLPFFSQGGSSLMAIYFAYGLVINIRRSMR